MNMPTTLLQRARARYGRKAFRYSAVSAVGVVVTQVLLATGYGLLGWPATVANVVAVSLASIPAYLLNRYWVWGKRGRNHLTREVLPFWGMAVLGLVLSTVLVAVADDWSSSTLAVNAANIVAFGSIWVAKFFILDAIMFGPHHHAAIDDEPLAEPAAA